MSTVQTRVENVMIEKFNLPSHAYASATRFVEDIGAVTGGGNDDMLPWIEFLMALEEEFEVHIPDEDYAQVLTLESMAAYIQARIE